MKSALCILLLAAAAGAQPTSQPAGSQPMDHAHHGMDHAGMDHSKHLNAPPADAATKDSLYQLEPALTDQNGQAMSLAVFKGRPTIVSMFFASCTAVCPLIISDIQRMEKALTDAERAQLGVVLVSFDTKRDGPKAFAEIITRHSLDATRWRLATASADDVRLLAAALGVRYTEEPNGDFVHSALITLVDGKGEVAARAEGILQPVEPLVEAFRKLPQPKK